MDASLSAHIKVSVDASKSAHSQVVDTCVVGRDSSGSGTIIAWRRSRVDRVACLEIAETLDVLHGVQLAVVKGWKHTIIESDCLVLITAINLPMPCLAVAGHFVDAIENSACLFDI